ncbi:hypothetical protein PSACC_00604, partial [Paramicrosporidium saccamoebae]
CIDPGNYSRVLGQLNDTLPPVSIVCRKASKFVRTVVNADYYAPSIGPFDLYPQNPPDLHPYYYYASDIHQLPFCKYCLVGRNRNLPGSLVTKKTAVYFLQGLFDVQTPFNLAKQVFDSIKAPFKVFQPFYRRGHGFSGWEEVEYIIAAVYGQSMSTGQQLDEKLADKRPMEWEFAETDNLLGKLWGCVNDAPLNEPVQGNFPKAEILKPIGTLHHDICPKAPQAALFFNAPLFYWWADLEKSATTLITLTMIFACFRTRRKGSDNAPTDISQRTREKTPITAKTHTKSQVKPTTVKLAPRTAILQTPKQAVGNRITEATSRRRRPTIELRRDQASIASSPRSMRTPSVEEPAKEIPAEAVRPISPVGMRPILNSGQHDELRQALARRAALHEANQAEK